MNAELGAWVVSQCLGIAEALTLLYGSQSQPNDAATGMVKVDIKPANILYFNEWTSAVASASDFSTDLVNLVRKDMLAFCKEDYMFGRLTSLALCEALSTMRQKIERNAAYCEPRGPIDMTFLRLPWTPPNESLTNCVSQVHSSRSTDADQGANRKRASSEVSITTENKTKRKKTDETCTNGESSDQTASRRKFACPFWKAGMDRIFLNRACGGPGWVEVHRVKEHIKRCHMPSSFRNPHVCGRCLDSFGSPEGLMQHQREETQCIIRAPEIMHGKITLEQAINLRSTKKKVPDMTDEEKWFEWFGILLPTHPLPSSPYYEDATSSTLNTLSTQSAMGISEYKEYLRVPLDDEKQKALEADLGEALGISNPAMCKILAAKFRDYQLRHLQKFDEDKLNQTYDIPGPGDLPAVVKGHDHAGDVDDGASAEFDSYLAEWPGAEDVWPLL